MYIAWIAASLETDLQVLAGLTRGLHHAPRPSQRVGHGGFTVHVQPCLEAGVGLLGMAEIRCGNDHGIQVLFLGQKRLKVHVGPGLVTVLLQYSCHTTQREVLPDVTDGLEANP